ncbi:MAG TPA: serine protease [Clostridia bacterium]|nr:serine protease [Clostridia bacterium]
MRQEPEWEDRPDSAGEQFTPEEELAPDGAGRYHLWLRLAAFITVLGFTAMVALPVWQAFKARVPPGELVVDSLRLKEQIDRELLAAVARIQVTTSEFEPAGAAGQRSGTGFNVSGDGVVITNYHVVEDARSITITFPGGENYKARSWVSAPEYDLAVIKLEKTGLPAVSLNPGILPQPGDTLMVIGNPLGLNQLVVEGTLRDYVMVKDMSAALLCIDAPIFPGNSGSPVFNGEGQVVAVVFASLRQDEEGKQKYYGLAVPIKEVLRLLENSR